MEVLKKIKKINGDSKRVKLDINSKIKVMLLIFIVGCFVGYVYEEIFSTPSKFVLAGIFCFRSEA